MTPELFNSLPLDARQYIEKQKTCLSCGKAADLDAHYKNFLAMKHGQLFTLRTGAVSYQKSGEGKILYPIHPTDSAEQIKEKLKQALDVNAIAPNRFSVIDTDKIEKILAAEEAPIKKLHGAAKAAAEKKAADKGAEDLV